MNKITILILIAAGTLAVNSLVYAQNNQVYTWTDENGVKHFVDTPPDNANATTLNLPQQDETGTNTADADADAQAQDSPVTQGGEDSQETVSYAQQRREQLAKEREERRKTRDEQDRICSQARQQLANVEPSTRVSYTDENGNTVRLDDDQRVALVKEQEALIAENCH